MDNRDYDALPAQDLAQKIVDDRADMVFLYNPPPEFDLFSFAESVGKHISRQEGYRAKVMDLNYFKTTREVFYSEEGALFLIIWARDSLIEPHTDALMIDLGQYLNHQQS